ncbi:MAG: sulfatase [bacterium]|nr:hypothetical protein [Planctomycetota bacterium]HIL50685.1 hypothetical protein [Planctomycetota bacterium]
MRAFGVLVLLVGCGSGEVLRPNLVLVTVDTLRADHLSCYGHFRETSPRLDELAAEGVVFERAYAVMGTTLPSHLSIMTGLYPHQHGFVANHGAMKGSFRSSEGRETLAEALRATGYNTAAFVSGPTVSRATGLNTGFAHFDEHAHPDPKTLADTSRRSRETTDAAIQWLESEPSQPFFLWVHYWDPHEPNIPAEPYASAFKSDAQLEALIDERRIKPERLAQLFSQKELARLFAPELYPALHAGEDVDLPAIGRAQIRELLNAYDGDVLATDASFGRVLDCLRGKGLYEEALIVFTADHGQALGQHDWLEHGRIQGENLHVPFVLRPPGANHVAAGRKGRVVSAVDLAPTLLKFLPSLAGSPFARQLSGADALDPGFLRNFAFSQRSVRVRDWETATDCDGLKFALTTGDWKFYLRPEGPDELYDLRRDPKEWNDVAADHSELTETLRRIIEDLLAERPHSPEGQSGDSQAARDFARMLEQIGYTGK